MFRNLRFALLSSASLAILAASSLALLGDSAECIDDNSIASKKITMVVEQSSCGPLGEFSFVTTPRDSCVTIEKVEGAEALGLPNTVIPVKERSLDRGFYLGAVERDGDGNYVVPRVDAGNSAVPDTGAGADAVASADDAGLQDADVSADATAVDAATPSVVDAASPDAGVTLALACVAQPRAEDGTWTLDCGTCGAVVRRKD